MFAVFGMTIEICIADAEKLTPTDVRTGGVITKTLTMREWRTAVEDKAEKLFSGARTARLSKTFSCPSHAADYMRLLQGQCRARSLEIRYKHKIKKENGKEGYEWRDWNSSGYC